MALTTFVLMGVLLLLGAPLAVSFGLTIFAMMGAYGLTAAGVSGIPYEEISNYALVAIPLFMLTGELMNRSGMAAELIALSDLLLRRVRAAFGYITVAASAMMGAITGSSVATVAAVGGVVSQEMIRRGYPKGYVASLTASAGLLGVLVPPSIPLILYGATVGVSVSDLFLAALLPAVIMSLLFLFVHRKLSRRLLPDGVEIRPVAQQQTGPLPAGSRRRVVGKAMSALMLPVVILGGIYGGIFTPTEAAAVGCVYAIVVSLIRRILGIAEMGKSFRNAAVTGAGILIIIAMTGVFNRAMVLKSGAAGHRDLGCELHRQPHRFPADGECRASRGRHFHGNQCLDSADGAAAGSGGAEIRHRSRAFRDRPGNQSRNWPADAADGRQSLCRRPRRQVPPGRHAALSRLVLSRRDPGATHSTFVPFVTLWFRVFR